MSEKQYYLSPGLEVVVIDANRLSISLYGRRFTVRDESGIIRSIFEAAREGGTGDAALASQFAEQFGLEIIHPILQSLFNANFLTGQDLRSTHHATADFLGHAAALTDKIGAGQSQPVPPGKWLIALMGDGELFTSLQGGLDRTRLRFVANPDLAQIASADNSYMLVVACADNESHSYFRKINAATFSVKLPSLYVRLESQTVRCGPTVIPSANACYECYSHRLDSTRLHPEEFAAAANIDNVICRPATSQLSIEWAVAAALTQIYSFISGLSMDLHLSPMQEIDVLNGEVSHSTLLKLPRCPVCGLGNANRPFSAVINTKIALKAS